MLENDYQEINELSLINFKTKTAKKIMNYKIFLLKEITYIEDNYENEQLGLGLTSVMTSVGKLDESYSPDDINRLIFESKVSTLKQSFYEYNDKNLDQYQKKFLSEKRNKEIANILRP